MEFWHGTYKDDWEKVQEQGFLLHERATEAFPRMSPCTYLAVDKEEAMEYGDILLKVKYNPRKNPKENNFTKDCWQVRVYEKIPIKDIECVKEIPRGIVCGEL